MIWAREIQFRRGSPCQAKLKVSRFSDHFGPGVRETGLSNSGPMSHEFDKICNFLKKLWIYQRIFMTWQHTTAEHRIFTDQSTHWIYSKIMSVLVKLSEKESFIILIGGFRLSFHFESSFGLVVDETRKQCKQMVVQSQLEWQEKTFGTQNIFLTLLIIQLLGN